MGTHILLSHIRDGDKHYTTFLYYINELKINLYFVSMFLYLQQRPDIYKQSFFFSH